MLQESLAAASQPSIIGIATQFEKLSLSGNSADVV
jgi:hypothetical protein